eukprot:3711310-Amphidinium_carterae.1
MKHAGGGRQPHDAQTNNLPIRFLKPQKNALMGTCHVQRQFGNNRRPQGDDGMLIGVPPRWPLSLCQRSNPSEQGNPLHFRSTWP